jgi:uncharacterized membrane protein YhaH (DUF805 family)
MEWMLMPIKRYADFSGRSRRQEYWMFVLFQILLTLAVALVFFIVGGMGTDGKMSTMGGVLAGIVGLAYLGLFFIPSIAVGIRRWHDQDKSGWFFLLFAVLSAIPVIGIFATIGNIVFMCLPGTSGPNRFGEDPLGKASLEDVFR